jgi:hypothetical protein
MTRVIPAITSARLYEETIAHIRLRHPDFPIELPSLTAAIERAVANPTHVEKSYEDSYVFVDSNTVNRAGDPLRVPVKVVAGTSGRVKSAYFASVERPGSIIWTRESRD